MPQMSIPQAMGLAIQCHQAGQFQQTESIYRQILQAQPGNFEAVNNLGVALRAMGRYGEAEAAYRAAIAMRPDYAEAYNNLGSLLSMMGQTEPAVDFCRKATALKPDYVVAHYNLGKALFEAQRIDEAIESYRRSIALQADFADGWNGLARACQDRGQIEQAISYYRKAVELAPGRHDLHGNLLLALHYVPDLDSATLIREHQLWSERHARPLFSQIKPHMNDRSPDRRLRVAYVSPNFRNHTNGWLIEPLLANHDHAAFEIVCYSDAAGSDAVTARLKTYADQWNDTMRLSDEQLAERIRQDQIDILVDLSLHTAGNRLLTFARKPAPIQLSYLGYPGSTGLETMDYRLTDPYLEPRRVGLGPPMPVGQAPPYSLEGPETPICLPDTYYCFIAPSAAPEVNQLPAAASGHVTFGSFNNFAKVNGQVIALWSRLLLAVRDSQILVLIPGGQRNGFVLEAFEAHGVQRERIKLLPKQPTAEQYFALYHQVDLTLDPFPYCGHTMSLESLWMGVPLVTLAGQRGVGRAGVSILSNVGLPELIAQTPEEYVKIAADLANDLSRMAELRRTLGERMRASPLMDGPRFARNVEAAYRGMWKAWCQRRC